MLWVLLGLLLLLSLSFLVLPLMQNANRMLPLLVATILFSVGLSAGLYHYLGSPGVPSGAESVPDVGQMVVSLAERLESNPDDTKGWIMLGRSYQTLERYDEAIEAYEKAVALEQGRNAQTLVALALALTNQQGGQLSDRASGLFENALALEPNDPSALFYAGGAAARRGNTALAADRWEILLDLNAPPEIKALLQQKISEWRGVAPSPSVSVAEELSIELSASDEVLQSLSAESTVFIIARDPSQPSPPIAVTRRQLSELPMVVTLSDRDAMIPGRPLSGFDTVEIVVRASASGEPAAQAGDWFVSQVIDRRTGDQIDLKIDQMIR